MILHSQTRGIFSVLFKIVIFVNVQGQKH